MSGSDGSPEIVDRLDECYTDSSTSAWTIPEITKESMDKFLAWALFAKDITTMSPVELEELDRCYQVLYEKVKLTFHHHADGASVNRNDSHRAAPRTTEPPSIRLQPRLLSLEDVSPWHRPLALYILVMMGRVLAGLFLRLAGFQRAVSTNGVVGWYRPGQVQTHLPLLFFHGIAPAGLLFYIPLVLWGLLSNNDDRPCFLFENPNISCRIQFDALDEHFGRTTDRRRRARNRRKIFKRLLGSVVFVWSFIWQLSAHLDANFKQARVSTAFATVCVTRSRHNLAL
jgi:hypothetical protein